MDEIRRTPHHPLTIERVADTVDEIVEWINQHEKWTAPNPHDSPRSTPAFGVDDPDSSQPKP